MQKKKVKFSCPRCGDTRLVRVRTGVEIREVVEGFVVADNPSPGQTFNLNFGFDGQTTGKVVRFECLTCKFPIKTKKELPIKSAKNAFHWLMRHEMTEDES